MEENKQIRIPLREDYRNGDLLRGRDVNKITHRVNELTGDIDKIDIDLSGKLDTSAYTEDKAAIEIRIDGVAEGLSANTTAITQLQTSKQDKLTAGSGITIENNVISAQQPDLSEYAKQCDVILVGSDMDGDKIDWSPVTGMTTPGVYRALLYIANQLITDEMIVQYFGSVEAFLAYCSQNGIKVIRDDAQSGYLIVEVEAAMRMTVTNYVVGSLVQSFTYDYSFAKHMYERVFDQSSNSWSTQYYRFLSGNDSNDLSSAFKSDVTFSRRKIEELLAGKQNKLTAGTNITIENDVISAQQPDLSPYALSADVATELAKKVDSSAYTQDKASMQASITANTTAITQLETSKQDKLTPGANVQIENGVISATDTKYDLSPYAKTADVATELAKKADASALTQVSVEINNRIAVDERNISGLEADKQDKLSAGTGIKIENNVVSLSGAGGAMIDDNVTGSTTCWSSQKVYDEMRITLTNLLPTGNVLAF